MKGVVVSVMVVLAMILFMVETGQAITCGQVSSNLSPCLRYLTGGGNPPPACCNGVRNIQRMAPTTADRRAACQCVKQAASRYPNIRPDAASQLPQRCSVNLGVPISMTVDCNRIR